MHLYRWGGYIYFAVEEVEGSHGTYTTGEWIWGSWGGGKRGGGKGKGRRAVWLVQVVAEEGGVGVEKGGVGGGEAAV